MEIVHYLPGWWFGESASTGKITITSKSYSMYLVRVEDTALETDLGTFQNVIYI